MSQEVEIFVELDDLLNILKKKGFRDTLMVLAP